MHHVRNSMVPWASRACTRYGPYGAPSRNFFSRRNNWLIPTGFREIDRTFDRMEREMNSIFRDFRNEFPFFQRGLLPMMSSDRSGSHFIPAIEAENVEGNKYMLKMDMGIDFSPENVKVTLKDKVVTIHAKFEKKSEDGASRMYQEVTRQFTLPENVKIDELKSILSPEGVLSIEAPLEQIEGEKKAPREIPIEKEAASN